MNLHKALLHLVWGLGTTLVAYFCRYRVIIVTNQSQAIKNTVSPESLNSCLACLEYHIRIMGKDKLAHAHVVSDLLSTLGLFKRMRP